MFERLDRVPDDPILGLMAAFRADSDPKKVDLGVGVFRDAKGDTPVLECVRKAEKAVLERQSSKTYVAPAGNAAFNQAMEKLVFGAGHPVFAAERIRSIQGPGGCGALRLGAELVRLAAPQATVHVSTPTWANHVPLMTGTGLQLGRYPYYEPARGAINFGAMCQALEALPAGEVVLLHASCHNPTGADLSREQWQELVPLFRRRNLLPYIDMAYQGLGTGQDEDAFGIRLFAAELPEVLVAVSCSKNFGLYRERVGVLHIVTDKPAAGLAALSHEVRVARSIYSMPPDHGAAIVNEILGNDALRDGWTRELGVMRERINGLRKQLVAQLRTAFPARDFGFIAQQRGMFSLLGLAADEVKRIRAERHVYMTDDSRINIAGLREDNIEYFARSVAQVLKLMAELSTAAAQLLRRLDSLAAEFAPHFAQAERRARLPPEISGPLLREGFFRLWIPARHGGLELSLGDALRIYEAAAVLDGSLGWAVMIGAGGGLFAAWLPDAGAQELFAPALALVAGSGAPSGSAEKVPGGYRVRGAWRFASGAHYASVFTAACVVTAGGSPVPDAHGQPLIRAMSISPADVRILDTWDPTGMRGTGSHDFEVRDALVPEHHSFSVLTDAPRATGPLYRLPFNVLTELPVSAVGLGIARRALREFAQALPTQKLAASGSAALSTRFAQARAALALASATVADLAAEAWRTVSQGSLLDATQLARITAICCVSQEQLRQAIGELASVAGMRAIDQRSGFSRAWRDLQTLGAHGSLAPQRLEAAGRVLLNQEARSDTINCASVLTGGAHTLPEHT